MHIYCASNEARFFPNRETSLSCNPYLDLEIPKNLKFDLHFTESHDSVKSDWNLYIQDFTERELQDFQLQNYSLLHRGKK